MKKKLTIVLALLILFILVILAFIGFFYYQTIDTNHKNITRLAQNRLEYASQRLLMGQRSIEDNAGTLLVDSDVRELRTDEKPIDDYSYLLQLNRISAKLKERLINSSDMADISLYWPQKDILISTESSPNLKNEMKQAPPIKGWRNTNRGLYFLMSYTFGNTEEETIVAIKASDSLLLEAQEALASNSDEAALLLPDGQVWGGSRELQNLIQKNHNVFQKSISNSPFHIKQSLKYFITLKVSDSQIQLISTLPTKQFDDTYTHNTLISLTAVLFVLGFGFILIFLYHRNVLAEISLLTTKLKLVEKGDYDTRIEHLHQNEFDYLFKQFNLMTSSIQRLFRTLVKEMQQRDLAEERQFQSQIQPHFLYNSLFYIVSVADQPQDVKKMTRHLAEYYRYLSKAKDRVCIQDEVEFARHYLSIQALRKDFQFQISLEEHVGQELILPLLIQPIIENAIEHGIEAKDGAHQINLSVKRKNSGIHISVSDDGPGMLLDDLETLYHVINQPHHQGDSIGLWNVNQRLKNAYGKEAGLHLKINDLGGLTIHFTINKESGGTYREMLDC